MRSRFFLSLMVAGALPLQLSGFGSLLGSRPAYAAGPEPNGDGWTEEDTGPGGDTILQFPGMPPVQVLPNGQMRPRGPHVSSPQGTTEHPAAALKPSLSPQEKAKAAKAEALKRAMAPQKTHAEIRGEMLDRLFKHLGTAADAQEAEAISAAIERVWLQSDSATANLLMQRGLAAMEGKHLPLALTVFDRLLLLDPSWAEAWEKRATTKLLGGDIDGAVADMRQALKLEPRQFSALAALGLVLHKQGLDKEALASLRKSLTIDPQQPQIKDIVDKLSIEVEGRDI